MAIESVLPGLPPVSFAIVGEPTEMQPAIAEKKGLMVLDVTATGKAGHAARNEGDNAIYKVLMTSPGSVTIVLKRNLRY